MKKLISFTLIVCMISVMLSSFSITSYAQNNTISLEKISVESSGGENSVMSKWAGTARWSNVIKSYVFDDLSTNVNILSVTDSSIYIDTYDKNSYELINSKSLPYELEKFGGFYSGNEYNYIVFGQNNTNEDDTAEVIRVVKYDKSFNKISSLAVKDCYTVIPFDAGSLRIAEKNGELVIHTSRERYLTEDGLNHQSQLTLIIDTENMSVKNDLGRFQDNHVSHSFNQFVKYDNNNHVLVDHGDAYPRSVVLNKYNGSSYAELNMLEIPGAIGANCTGITIGGFEISQNNYLVAINKIDHSKVSNYTSFEMEGLEKDERDVILLISAKNNTTTSNVKQIRYTDYINNNKLSSTPYLVKLSENKFALLWEEYTYINEYDCESNGVKYVFVDEDGNALSAVYHESNAHLSIDCQPILIDGKIVWYVNDNSNRRTIYSIDTYLKFEGISLEDAFFEYDGTEKQLQVTGELPNGATIEYTNNAGTEQGIYNVTAKIMADGYHSLELKADMTIGYKINNVVLPVKGYEVGKPWDNCWTFAYEIYEKIWNTDDGDNLLRALELEDRKITEKNTRNFILSSEVGANIRLEDGNDENIHSLILANKDSNGFTVYHGNYNGGIYFTHYTYSEFAEHYADYKYFEYITYPNAPEYSKAPQYITVDDIPTKTYGDVDFNLTVNKDTTSNLENFTYASSNENVATVDDTGKVTIKGAGEAEISVTEAGNEDYAQTTVTKTLTVNKKVLEIKVDNVTITYGDAINTNITYTGFIDGEDETILTKAVEVGGYSAKPNVGEYDIVLSGAEAANYEISYANAKLTVNKKDVTVTQLKVFDKVADTTTDATINTSSLVIEGMILGDDVAIDFTNAVAAFATAEMGTDIAVTITSLELIGTHAENYNLTNTEIATTASIKETITASDIATQITALSVVKDSTEITLPNVPAGYKITVKSSDNEAVVKTDGSVAPVENDTQVGLILTVTNEADETDVADTAVINVTIPASTKINVAVTTEANGTVTGSGEYLKNSDVTVAATPNNGYEFSGWYFNDTLVSQYANYTFKAVCDIELIAKFTKKTVAPAGGGGGGVSRYTVKFETNGGSAIKSVTVNKNAIVTEPTAPTKEGLKFEGWYTDKELTTAYDFAAKVTKSFTLYAKWEEIEKEPTVDEPNITISFKDVKADDWFYANVQYVVGNKLMNGVGDDKFAPNDTLTRAMLVTVLYRNAGEPATNRSIPFADVDMGAYYADAVSWAKQNGIANGATEDEFAPDANITREQIAAIMFRYAQYKGMEVVTLEENIHFADNSEISEYAVSAMNWAVGTGLMKGKSATTINPKDNATRAEIAAILQRFIEANK